MTTPGAPPGSASDEVPGPTPDARLVRYIRDNRRRYTRSAIIERLTQAGYDPGEIEAAWATLADRDDEATIGDRFWVGFWIYLIGANLAAILLVGVLTGVIGQLAEGGGALLTTLAVALAIGALIAWAIVALTRPTQLGRGAAIAIGAVVPLFFTFLIAGACYGLVGTVAPPPATGTMELRLTEGLAFEGSGSATCYQQASAGTFSTFSENLGSIDGRQVSASVDRFTDPTGQAQTSVVINVFPTSGEGIPASYTNGPGAELEVNAAPDALSGTASFSRLTSQVAEAPNAPRPDSEPISGTITWTCE